MIQPNSLVVVRREISITVKRRLIPPSDRRKQLGVAFGAVDDVLRCHFDTIDT
jgi:hypothetical protein